VSVLWAAKALERVNGNPRPVIPDTISGQLRAGLSPEFLSPYADGEVANRPVLLHQLSDATVTVPVGVTLTVVLVG
jgi:hypothetical protein